MDLMAGDYRNTLRAHASALSSLGKAYTHLASQHRIAASAAEKGQQKITYDRYFSEWILKVNELSAAAERLLALEIELARSFGVIWVEVGAALGVSRQAAWDRFASHERVEDPAGSGTGAVASLASPAMPADARGTPNAGDHDRLAARPLAP